MGKFSRDAEILVQDMGRVFNQALRRSLAAAVRAAAENTNHDSSNAAYHWLIGEKTKSRPASRRLGTVRDLRGRVGGKKTRQGSSKKRRPKGTVGYRGDGGRNRYKTNNAVVSRGKVIIEKYVSGRDPSREFVLYHGLLDGKTEDGINAGKYRDNANIDEAAKAGAEAFYEHMNRALRAGLFRKGK